MCAYRDNYKPKEYEEHSIIIKSCIPLQGNAFLPPIIFLSFFSVKEFGLLKVGIFLLLHIGKQHSLHPYSSYSKLTGKSLVNKWMERPK